MPTPKTRTFRWKQAALQRMFRWKQASFKHETLRVITRTSNFHIFQAIGNLVNQTLNTNWGFWMVSTFSSTMEHQPGQQGLNTSTNSDLGVVLQSLITCRDSVNNHLDSVVSSVVAGLLLYSFFVFHLIHFSPLLKVAKSAKRAKKQWFRHPRTGFFFVFFKLKFFGSQF